MSWGWEWKPYVSVAERREQARRKMSKLQKQGVNVQPVEIEGRKIARTFWGQSWCKHLESFSDYENRLPRGRTYVCNGSVCHLEIAGGEIKAIVSGSELYDVKIAIKKLPPKKWSALKERCSGQIGSLLELLAGRLSVSVMSVVTNRKEGLFPLPAEIDLDCSCPDWASMCKHVAAVLYGVGARLDEKPELLFLLRGVDHEELIEAGASAASVISGKRGGRRRIAQGDLEDIFGIEMLEEKSPDNGQRKRKPSKGITEKRQSRHSSAGEQKGTGTSSEPAKKKQIASKATTRGKKKSARGRTGAREVSLPDSTAASNGGALTGKTVRELRARFDMSQSQLAQLIGASAASINNWEKKSRQLNLQARTMSALSAVRGLTKKQAWSRLD